MDCGTLIILGNALVLGIRHGTDWDHVAAIADIVGTTTDTGRGVGAVSIMRQTNALRLSSFYAFGHAAIVLVLGTAALKFATVLPEWIDPVMERAVGCTLLLLSVWIFYSLSRQLSGNGELVFQSRWMFLLKKLSQFHQWLHNQIIGETKCEVVRLRQYDAPVAFGIGLIHGFGAETGTQVLLIAAVGASSSPVLGILILFSFVLGLLISNSLVAILTCAGFLSSARFKSLFVGTTILTGLFSLVIGAIFVSGAAKLLPALQH